MADNQKPSPVQKSPRLGSSVSYKIGGKDYRPGDMSKMQAQANAPRSITSVPENLHGVINTKVDTRPGLSTQPASQSSGYRSRPEQGTEVRTDAMRMGATEKLTLGSVLQNESYQRTAGYTQGARDAERMFHVAGNVRNGEVYQKIAEGKALAGRFASGTESAKEHVRGLGVVAKYTVSTEYASALKTWKEPAKKGGMLTDGKVVLGKAASSVSSGDDLGSQSVGGVIATAGASKAAFKFSQGATEIGVPAARKVGTGVYHVSNTVVRGSVTVGRTVKTAIDRNQAIFSKETLASLRANAKSSGFSDTRIVKSLSEKATSVKDGIQKTGEGLKKAGAGIASGARTVKTAVDTSVKIVRGVTSVTLKLNLSKEAMEAFRNRAFQGIKTGLKKGVKTAAGYTVRGTAKGLSVAAFKGVPKAGKVLNKGTTAAAGVLMASEDPTVRGIGYAMTGTKMAVKTAYHGAKATGYTVKTAVKGGKAVAKGAKFVKNNGWKKGWKRLWARSKQAVARAGKSVVSAMLHGLKTLGAKVAVPALLIIIVVALASGAGAAPMAAIGSLFGGIFNTTNDTGEAITEHDIRTYLMDTSYGIPALSASYQQDLIKQMQASVGSYNIVRFYSNTEGNEPVEATADGVASVFPINEQIANMLQPMFNAVVLMDYELSPTHSQAQALVREMFLGLFRVEPVESIEYCGQAISDGSGDVTRHDCGYIHAADDCLNDISDYHRVYTCASCCRYAYVCEGHKGSLNCNSAAINHAHTEWVSESEPGCYSTVKHDGEMQADCGNSTKRPRCSGYKYCLGHSVISYNLTLDGAYALESMYFREQIDRLSNIPERDRTQEEREQLANLKSFYEVYRELVTLVAQQYGGGLTMSDLSGVNFINGTRKGNQAVVDLALSQIGQMGGQPYWSYYGFGSRVEWCGCFVHWCMRNTPSATAAYPQTANNAYCPAIASHFQSIGQWGNKDFTNLVPGDVILFDWEGDGEADHVGIVIGQDGTYVYTVEGNSGDAVVLDQYLIGSSVICGYGLMNY